MNNSISGCNYDKSPWFRTFYKIDETRLSIKGRLFYDKCGQGHLSFEQS